jgi:hypothetical protein
MVKSYSGMAQSVSQPKFTLRVAELCRKLKPYVAHDTYGSKARNKKFKADWKAGYKSVVSGAA